MVALYRILPTGLIPRAQIRGAPGGRTDHRVHVRPIYDDGGLRRISHGVRRMDKNVRRVWNHRVDV